MIMIINIILNKLCCIFATTLDDNDY